MSRLFLVVTLLLLSSVPALASIGVGVGTGKIQVDDKLRPGTIYELPPLTVLNTGDQGSDYEVAISYNEKQVELKPASSWFHFEPEKFYLEPGKVQTVAITLSLPVRMEPGDYFSYLEAHPTKKAQNGQTSVGVAAAAKLYFTVVPANIFTALYYRGVTYWRLHHLALSILGAVAIVLALGLLVKKNFNIQFAVKKRSSEHHKRTDDDA